MNELVITKKELPDTLEDLSKFALIGREKLTAVKAEIRAIEKVGLAKEVHEQKLVEAQEIAEAVLDAEVKIGELTKEMEKSAGGRPSETTDSGVHSLPTKASQLEEIGISEKQKQRYETLAKHPETVKQAKEDARAEGRIVTRSDVLNRIAPPKSPKPTMKEFNRDAKERHEEFKQALQKGVVDFEDIQKDKDDTEIIALDVLTTINRALAGITSLGILKDSEVELMNKNLTSLGRQTMKSNCYEASRMITHILKIIGGE